MNRAVASRFMALRRAVMQNSKRNDSHGHEIVNAGPPITLDYMPVPFQPYQKVHGELNAKFNMFLAFSVALFVGSFTLACVEDVFAIDALRPPSSYRNRK